MDDSRTVDDSNGSIVAEKDLVGSEISVGSSSLNLEREEERGSTTDRREERNETRTDLGDVGLLPVELRVGTGDVLSNRQRGHSEPGRVKE